MTNKLSDETLAELERLEREAIRAPWEIEEGTIGEIGCLEWSGPHLVVVGSGTQADARFVLAIRNSATALIAEVRRARSGVPHEVVAGHALDTEKLAAELAQALWELAYKAHGLAGSCHSASGNNKEHDEGCMGCLFTKARAAGLLP